MPPVHPWYRKQRLILNPQYAQIARGDAAQLAPSQKRALQNSTSTPPPPPPTPPPQYEETCSNLTEAQYTDNCTREPFWRTRRGMMIIGALVGTIVAGGLVMGIVFVSHGRQRGHTAGGTTTSGGSSTESISVTQESAGTPSPSQGLASTLSSQPPASTPSSERPASSSPSLVSSARDSGTTSLGAAKSSSSTNPQPNLSSSTQPGPSSTASTLISGSATFWSPSSWACGPFGGDINMVASLSPASYESGKHCFKEIGVHHQNKYVQVTVVDECFTCADSGQIDLSPGAFQQLSPLSEGKIKVDWGFV